MDNRKIIKIEVHPLFVNKQLLRLECGHTVVWDETVGGYAGSVGACVSCNECPDDVEWQRAWGELM